jgi:hypothetical protein
MSTLAAVAVRETALISGTGMFHGFAPGAIDGFAVGALATGACCLAIAAPRLLHRARLSARDGMWGTGVRRSKVRRDYFAAPVDIVAPADFVAPADIVAPADFAAPVEADPAPAVTGPAATAELFAPEAEVLGYPAAATGDRHEASAEGEPSDTEVSEDPFAVVDDEDAILPGTRSEGPDRDQSGRSGHRSKHRITSSDADRRSEPRRQPRHAAPSGRLATRVSGKFAARPLVVRS